MNTPQSDKQPEEKDSRLDDIREILVDFGLPALIIITCVILLATGIDGEVKSILALAAGWIFKSGYKKAKR
jgi:hypothetical protein